MEQYITLKRYEHKGSFIELYYNKHNMRFGLKSDFGCEQFETPVLATVERCFDLYLEKYAAALKGRH